MVTEIIDKIKTASKIEDVLSISDFKTEFNNIIKEIHPDVCSLDGASEATKKMLLWKEIFENGKEYKNDVGTFVTNGYWVEFKSTEKNHSWSIENYRLFKQLKDTTSENFKRYIPKDGILASDGIIKYTFDKRAIPLSGLTLPQEHVNWVLNRLLEYCAYLSQLGFSHCGLNPESVFIVPETHGIQVCSFYHLTRLGNRIGTLSGKYINWYPNEIFATKTAVHKIDIECSKKIASYLLGDTSGSGIKFKKTHNEDFINFIVTQDENAYKALTFYKGLLKKNFKKEFHLLTI